MKMMQTAVQGLGRRTSVSLAFSLLFLRCLANFADGLPLLSSAAPTSTLTRTKPKPTSPPSCASSTSSASPAASSIKKSSNVVLGTTSLRGVRLNSGILGRTRCIIRSSLSIRWWCRGNFRLGRSISLRCVAFSSFFVSELTATPLSPTTEQDRSESSRRRVRAQPAARPQPGALSSPLPRFLRSSILTAVCPSRY